MENGPQIKVRLSAIVLNSKKEVILGRIKVGYDSGKWTFPERELKFGETYHMCFFRELWSSIGFRNTDVLMLDERPTYVTSDIYDDEEDVTEGHCITLFFRGKHIKRAVGEKNKEKYQNFRWFEWGNFPEPLSLPVKKILKDGYNPFP